jgi:hypothetical protein
MLKRVLGLILAIVAVSSVVGAVGCGGSSNEEALTKSEFVEQGNAICEKAEEERGKIFTAESEKFDPNGDVQAQQTKVVQSTIPTYQQAAEQLGELAAPEDKTEQLDGLVGAMEETVEQIMANPQTAIVSNVQFESPNQKAKELELDSCAW